MFKGGRARANPPRRRGALPNTNEGNHVDGDIGDYIPDVHLDEYNEAKAIDRSFYPR